MTFFPVGLLDRGIHHPWPVRRRTNLGARIVGILASCLFCCIEALNGYFVRAVLITGVEDVTRILQSSSNGGDENISGLLCPPIHIPCYDEARYLAKAYDSGGVSDASSVLLGGGRKSGVIETIEIVPWDGARDQEMVSIDGLLLPVNAKSGDYDEATASAPRQGSPLPASDNAGASAGGTVSAELEEERPASPEELLRYRKIAESESDPAGEPDEMVNIVGVMLPRKKMLNILNYFPR